MMIDDVWGTNELAKNSRGGTEMMRQWLWDSLLPAERESVQIITSRVREVATDRPVILWLHDLALDPENQHLSNAEFRSRFAKLVFVSRWQFDQYRMAYNIRYNESITIPNGIDPIVGLKDDPAPIRLIYHTTPHRGLEILVPVVEHLVEREGYRIELDVFSSFAAYGWPDRDRPYEQLFDKIRSKTYMLYHGYQSNDVVREALKRAHIFAYPSIWEETSCIAAMEALTAGCVVLCPDYGALPETTTPFSILYRFDENPQVHANRFAEMLRRVIQGYQSPAMRERINNQASIAANLFDRRNRLQVWRSLIAEVNNAGTIRVGA